jgi:hypothetical protein
MAATEKQSVNNDMQKNQSESRSEWARSIDGLLKRANWEVWLVSAALFLGNQLLEKILILQFATDDHQMCRLDCVWYQGIATGGYTSVNPEDISYTKMQNWAFFPLFPLLSRLLIKSLSLRPETATILAAKLFFFLSIYFFISFAKAYIKNINSITPGLIAAFNPYSIYANAGYTEPLFLMLTCLFFIQLKRGNYLMTGVFGFLLPLTRSVGIAAWPSTVLKYLNTMHKLKRQQKISALIALISIPAGLFLFMAHLSQQTGDPLAFIHIQQAWRGSAGSINPFSLHLALSKGLNDRTLWLYPYWSVTAITVLVACVYLLFSPHRRHASTRSLAMFSLVCTMLPISSDAWGMTRYVWWQAPVLLAICWLILRLPHPKSALIIWAIISLAGNIYCYHQWFTPLKWHLA